MIRIANPDPLPTPRSVRIIGTLEDGVVSVLVEPGGVAFPFEQAPDGAWVCMRAETAARGVPLDEEWLTAARLVAIEGMRNQLRETAGEPSPIRCRACGRLLIVALEDPSVEFEISCSAPHEVHLSDGTRRLLSA